MATKNNRRTKLTRKLLKDSLIELMHEKSINQITIKEICEVADLNRSTFYLHFTDQFALLEDIENEILETTFDYLKDVGPGHDTLTYIEVFLTYVQENADIFETLLCKQETANFQLLFIRKIMEQLKDSLPSSYSSELEPYIYSFLLNGCIHIIMDWISNGFQLTAGVIAKLIFDLCDNSYRAPIK